MSPNFNTQIGFIKGLMSHATTWTLLNYAILALKETRIYVVEIKTKTNLFGLCGSYAT